MGKIYSFTHNQLKTLLKGCGYDRVAGLSISTESLKNEIVLSALNELTKSGIVFVNNDTFEIDDPVKAIVDCLGNSRGYIIMHSNRINLPDKCLFVSDEVLVCTGRIADKTRISIGFTDVNSLFEDICDEGYLDVLCSELVVEESELEEFESGIFASMEPNAPLSANSSVLFSLEELTIDGQLLRFFRVIDYYFYTYVVYCEGDTLNREVFTPKNAKVYFEKMIQI